MVALKSLPTNCNKKVVALKSLPFRFTCSIKIRRGIISVSCGA
nr:MAG TPA: hypothetical protein [Caudoviricetes sp.]